MEGPIASYMASPILELYCDCAAFAICVAALVALHDEYARPMLTSEHVLCICNGRSKESGYEKEVKDGFCDELDEPLQIYEDYQKFWRRCYNFLYQVVIIESILELCGCAGPDECIQHKVEDYEFSLNMSYLRMCFPALILENLFSVKACATAKQKQVIGVNDVDRRKDSGYERAVKDGFFDEDECIQDKVEDYEFSPFAIRFAALVALPNKHATLMLTAEHLQGHQHGHNRAGRGRGRRGRGREMRVKQLSWKSYLEVNGIPWVKKWWQWFHCRETVCIDRKAAWCQLGTRRREAATQVTRWRLKRALFGTGRMDDTDSGFSNYNRRPFHKIDFPTFSGGDPRGWILKAEKYFRFYNTLDEEKVDVAAIHLEGDALDFYSWIATEQDITYWEELVSAMQKHYGPPEFQNPDEYLCSVKQTGTVHEYRQEFTRRSARVNQWPDHCLLGVFLSGLKEELKTDVRLHKPRAVYKAVSLALAYESKLSCARPERKPFTSSHLRPEAKPFSPTTQSSAFAHPPKPDPKPNTRLSEAEKHARYLKGECFRCGAKYGPGHRCQTWLRDAGQATELEVLFGSQWDPLGQEVVASVWAEAPYFVKIYFWGQEFHVTGVIDVDRCKDTGFETTVEHGFWDEVHGVVYFLALRVSCFLNLDICSFFISLECIPNIISSMFVTVVASDLPAFRRLHCRMVALHNEYARPVLTAEHVIGVVDVDKSKDSGYKTAVKDGFWDEVIGVIDVDRRKDSGYERAVKDAFFDELDEPLQIYEDCQKFWRSCYKFLSEVVLIESVLELCVCSAPVFLNQCNMQVSSLELARLPYMPSDKLLPRVVFTNQKVIVQPFVIRFAVLVALLNKHARPMLTAEHMLCICRNRSNDSGYEKAVKDGFCDEVSSSELAHLPCTPRD
ncbi:hypothetical protein E3N88_03337 [Mikania micrantha]|uniref:Retrotransposon gag domain-containing protein n=1 Tax=Mikania micrantha TaxID=192012 RepID=A0A5N6Q8K2_9ASTR|nr:hypothetical protein E3N88_03337 [Mikania micrantha]